jgi:hypothetical protein
MRMRPLARLIAASGTAFALVIVPASADSACAGQRYDGLNVVAVPEHRFGSASARRSLAAAKRLGAKAIAIVPFLWQASPTDPAIGRGKDMSDEELRNAIRDARSLGLTVMIKPHVWVPQSWAGAIAPTSEADWATWFAGYRAALTSIAAIAAEERADSLVIGTELAKTTHRAEWFALIQAVRAAFPGTLLYVAHNADEAERVPFWSLLDLVGVSLYPALGADDDRVGRLTVMRASAQRLDQIAARTDKRIVVGEIGLRSARGAAAKTWESAEERPAAADPWLQAEVLADWLAVLRRPTVSGVMVWRWFTDPNAGGYADTDFTVQGKPAEGVLMCAWTVGCGQ